MNLLVLVYLTSLTLSLATIGMLMAQPKRDSSNGALVFFIFDCMLWSLADILCSLPVFDGYELTIYRFLGLVWIPSSLWFMLFLYKLIRRPFDWLFWLSAALCAAAALYVTTDMGIAGAIPKPWGAVDVWGPYYLFFAGVPVLVGVACFFVMIRGIREEAVPRLVLSLRLVLGGGIAILGMSSAVNVLLPLVDGWEEIPRLASGVVGLFAPFMYFAMYRYEFMTLSAARVAERLFDEVSYGVVILGREGSVRRINPGAVSIFGLDGAERPMIAAEDVMRKLGPKPGQQEKEVTIPLEGGEVQTLLFSKSRIIRSGVEIGELVLVYDLTAQKKAESILRRSRDELDQMAQAKSRQLRRAQNMEALGALAGGIAHDFNNLLAAVQGFATAALDEIDDDMARADVREILQATREARGIVRQLMDFSRRSERADQPVDLWRIVRGVRSLLHISMPPGVRFETTQRCDGCFTRGDPSKLHQVFMNLCKNASHAMERTSGVLEVILDEAVVGAESPIPVPPGRYVTATVRDTGEGMDEEVLEKIFEPFFTTRREQEGTGLGLPMVSRILDEHGGGITVESEVGTGTEFSVYLPWVPAPQEPKGEGRSIEGIRGTERIMLVDDKEQIVRVARRLMEPLGYQLSLFTDPRQALAEFEADPGHCDLVITDHLMPDLSGLELVAGIRDISPDVPIIMISGNLSPAIVERGEELGIASFLDKPISRSALGTAIRDALDGNRNPSG